MKPNTLCRLASAAVTAAVIAIGTPLRASEADDKIEWQFKNTYAFKSYLTEDSIKAEAKDGVVMLTGTVAEETHKTLAQAIAENLVGVTRVDNRLAVTGDATAGNSDAWICRKVILALQFHSDLITTKTNVEVKDGVVTLTGEVAGLAQRSLAAEYAADIEGVKEVRNELVVASILEQQDRSTKTAWDDASISAQIRTMLITHQSTRLVIVKVATHNGEVTLTGMTKNDAQRALIVKRVSDIRGVVSVKNLMTVENEPRN